MILIFFLCVKLSILHFCVSDLGYQCYQEARGAIRKTEIYLVKESNSGMASDFQVQLNEAFIMFCHDYYEILTGPLYQADPSSDNIIHFAVPDYYDGKPLNHFVYAGNISRNDNAACTKTIKKKPEYDCHEFANLVSESVLKMNDGHLYDFVQAMEFTDDEYVKLTTTRSCEPLRSTSDLNVVLLCLREEDFFQRQVNIKPLKLIQVPDNLCPYYLNSRDEYLHLPHYSISQDFDWDFVPQELLGRGFLRDFKYINRVLAVLAPEPYKKVSDSSVPAIFYETPYMYSEEKTDFPNSMNLVPWRLLKYGFLKFIQTVGWQRVAIVSDDSEYSVAFEDELTALFRKEKGIVHTVIRCEDANCDMGKIAQKLNAASAWIVIANVEETNARLLIRNTNHRITWLLRDTTGEIEVLANNKVAFSFSLHIDTKTLGCDVEDNILTSLSGIAQAYENTKEYASILKKRDFYRLFADELQRVTPSITEAEIVVKKTSKFDSKEISRMSVNANGVQNISNEILFLNGKPRDGTTECLVTTYDYYKPCEDPLVLLLMFTLMLFVLTILLITCYYDKTSPFNDIRYQHF